MLALPRGGKSFSVLITEPDEAYWEGFGWVFEPPEFEPIFARTGPEAIEIALKRFVHLLVMDMDIGEMDGLGVIRIIHEQMPSIPSILLVGELTKEERLEALSDNVQTLIQKPPDFSLLKMVARRILERHYS